VQCSESHGRTDCDFSGDADSFLDTDKLETVAG